MQASSISTIELAGRSEAEIHSMAGTSRNSGELELHYCQGSFLGQAKSKPTCQKYY